MFKGHFSLVMLLLVSLAAACAPANPPVSPAASTTPLPGDPERQVFEPEAGVACDRSIEVCKDKHGASVLLTRSYFGDAAADNLIERVRSSGAYSVREIANPTVNGYAVASCLDAGQLYCGQAAAERFCRMARYSGASGFSVGRTEAETYRLGDKKVCARGACTALTTVTCLQ